MKRVLKGILRSIGLLGILLLLSTCTKEDNSCKDVIQGDFELVE